MLFLKSFDLKTTEPSVRSQIIFVSIDIVERDRESVQGQVIKFKLNCLLLLEFYFFGYHSIALATLYQKSFESNSVQSSVRS
jgi:hypothetical protein